MTSQGFLRTFGSILATLALVVGRIETPSAQEDTKPDASAKTEPSKSGESPKSKPRPVRPENYGPWESLSSFSAELSPDGRWLAYVVSRVNEENELQLRMLATDAKKAFPFGSQAKFSADSKWLAFAIGVAPKEREKLEKDKKPIHNKLGLHSLVNGKTEEFEHVQSFDFSDDGRFLVRRTYAAEGRKSKGTDIVVRELETGVDTGFGNISEYRWNDKVSLLALVVDAENQAGNGVQLFNPASGVLRALDSAKATYKNLAWRKDADDLAAFKEIKSKEEDEDVYHEVLSWRGLKTDGSRKKTLDPITHEEFPKEFRLVDYGGLKWSDDGETVFFAIKAWEKKPKNLGKPPEPDSKESAKDADDKKDKKTSSEETKSKPAPTPEDKTTKPPAGAESPAPTTSADSKKAEQKKPADEADKKKPLKETLDDPAGVEVWHATDIEIIPRQKKTEERDRKKSFLAAWRVAENRFVQLGNDLTEDVELLEGQKRALGTDNTPYETEKRFGPTLVDGYLIRVATGERRKILEKNKFRFGSSPDGNFIPFIRDQHYWVYDILSDRHRNLTESIDTHFINQEIKTLTDEKPPYGFAGWTKDSKRLLVYDRFDLWMLAADGSEAKRLTEGAAQKIEHRRIVFDPEEDKFIDPKAVTFLRLYGDRTKKTGFASLMPGEAVDRLVWNPRRLSGLKKAKKADVYAYVEEDADDSPDFFVGGKDLKDTKRVTETNPFQKDFLWTRSELIEYTNDHGEALQGALFYPAGYEAGKKYPMIVLIYELLSPGVHNYSAPSERNPYNTAVFTAEGYFVFQPDIVYRVQNPGLSAKECVLPAVKKVLESGMIDPARVGLVGHSWGGYQTAFLSTQTDVFAALVAGAPLTDMISMSMSIYWNTGQTDTWIFHESQGRMDRPFWLDVPNYIQNSAVFNIDKLQKPLLIAFGDKDGAVDWQQGIEMYNAARLSQKPVVMLVYPGENHGLAKKPNQVDYHYRVLEWFGHYLKGDPAPKWITKGQSFLDRQKEIDEFKKARKKKEAK
ncbi:MAG: prolyl oligopeptidase family serine peptidase [Verrucomicrobia bacterium]|nr:prolyl oligopeptidase family serine peptidase [Verrucomicrobiota bacterium]